MPLVSIADLNSADAAELIEEAKTLSSVYDRFIESEPPDQRLPGIHASEVSGCPRKIVYSILNYEKRGSIIKNWRQRFQVGHAIHGMLQRDFKKMAEKSWAGGMFTDDTYVTFEEEIRISPERQPLANKWFINSACDGLFTFYSGQTSPGVPNGPPILRVGLEIKTESPDGYEKLKGPKSEHIDQAHVYMACLDIPLMWFCYMNKGNQNNTPSEGLYLTQFDPQRWESLEAKFAMCHDHAKRDELPARQESIVCQFCNYSYICQPNILRSKVQSSRLKPWIPT